MEHTQSFSVANLRQTSSLSECAFYLYAYTCGKIYIERMQGCKFMNLRTHTHIYIKLQLLVIKNFCTIKLGFICKYIALKQKFIPIFIKQKYSHLTSFLREERTSFYPSAKTIDHTVQSAEYQFLQFQSLIFYTTRTA